MRTRNLRPMFDRLDTRIVLDGGATVVTGANVGAALLAVTSTDQSSIIPTTDWYLPGCPPPSTPDPSMITIPWDNLNS